MSVSKSQFFGVTVAAHAVAVVVVIVLFLQTQAMTAFCTVAATLIGCGSVSSVPGRSVSTYAAFGALMGYAFWSESARYISTNFWRLSPPCC